MSDMRATVEDVYHAYRLLLGREPDPGGLETYQRMIASRSITSADLASFFLDSPEFVARRNARADIVEVKMKDGYSMYVRNDDLDIGASIAEGKDYEPHVAAVVKEVLNPGATFVDVGANIGYFVALAAHLVGPTGRVVAVEPMDKNIQLISATLWRNGFTHVEVFPFAASSSVQMVPMATRSSTSNGEVVRPSASGAMPTLFAHARRLEDMLRTVERIDLIKFDIEGHELPAWRGFADGIARQRPMVLTEFHPKCMRENAGVEPVDYLNVLFEYGASVEVLRGPADRAKCRDSSEVMAEWDAADRRLRSNGTTHLDLFVRPKNP